MDNLPPFFGGGIIILFVHNRFYKKKKYLFICLREEERIQLEHSTFENWTGQDNYPTYSNLWKTGNWTLDQTLH